MPYRGNVTRDEYEEMYREALLCIPTPRDGEPYIGPDGERRCRIAGIPLKDSHIFEWGWGPEIARWIEEQMPTTVNSVTCMALACLSCFSL